MEEQENEKNNLVNDRRSYSSRLGSTSYGSDSYEELLRGSVPCPTCRGKGNIPKEQEGELVALIPVRDKRLKPRRTCLYVGIAVFTCTVIFYSRCLYVGIAVFTCIVTAGLLFFFFSQRDVTIASNVSLLSPHNLTIDTAKKYVYFEVTYPFNISNLNYFPITLTQTSIAVQFNVKVINTTVSSFTLNVPMRSTRKFDVNVGITFSKDNGLAAMASRCNNPEPFFTQYVMIFLTTATYSSLGHQEQTTVNTYPLVDCGNHTKEENLIFSPEYSSLIS
ncbi:transmembrane protein 106B-like isoform X1 [Mytilus edulis]|uniref:transmembrane protein 106B-like isoform X1 n=1 Tax=Mytilus edulis TaxID=6550 RepID=UPI0039EE1CC7